MMERFQISRRQWLRFAMAASSCGLRRPLLANTDLDAATSKQLIDTHVYLGEWPHAYLANGNPTALIATLRRHGVIRAWAGSFDGLFHKDVAGVNERLVEACRSVGENFLIPIGTVNPMLPDWEEDVRRCDEQHRMRGIRLHPNYHGYALGDQRFGRLLEIATDRQLVLQLVVRLRSRAHRWLSPKAKAVVTGPLLDAIKKVPEARMVIAGGGVQTDDEATQALMRVDGIYFDVSGETGRDRSSVQRDNRDASGRFVFGSQLPLFGINDAFEWYRRAGIDPAGLTEPSWEN